MTDIPRVSGQNGHGDALTLSTLQRTWLAEIGIDRRTLARYVKAGAVPSAIEHDAADRGVTAKLPSAPQNQAADQGAVALRRVRVQLSPQSDVVKPAGLTHIGVTIGKADPGVRHDLPSDWTALAAHAEACRACDLQAHRDQLVFGAGDTDQPEWLIIGEAPSKADDRTGHPFQGKAGQLLHAMLIAAGIHPGSVTLGSGASPVPSWSQPVSVYFGNVVKCRPLGNRSPTGLEIASCLPYLQQQIELLQPRRILALGRLAAQALLYVDADVDALRGRIHHLTTRSGAQIPLIVTWHPASLLVHPQHKAQTWEDLTLARRVAG